MNTQSKTLYLLTSLVIALAAAYYIFSPSDKDLYNKHWKNGYDYSDSGEWEKAAAEFTLAIKYYPHLPGNYGSYVNRANAYSMLGDLDKSLSDYNKVLDSFSGKTDVRLGEVYFNRGEAYNRNGKPDLAIFDYEKAISIDDKIEDAHNKLAWKMATSPIQIIRNGKKAVAYAMTACKRTDFKRPGYLDTLSAAHAENGDFLNAIKYQEMAIALLTDADKIKDYTTRLELYKVNKPFRASK